MRQELTEKRDLRVEPSGLQCEVGALLGAGSQGEVYQATLGASGRAVALKWYYPSYLLLDVDLRQRLEMLIHSGPPTGHFLWPEAIVTRFDRTGLGYLMRLREARHVPIAAILNHSVDISLRAITMAGYQLADSLLTLHMMGYCYRDINYDNVLLDPATGEIMICDNDNVDVDGAAGPVLGTPLFMAPEIIRGESPPRTQTDLHALAVLLFMMLHSHHPFFGRRILEFDCLDRAAVFDLCAYRPAFIFDPGDPSNAVLPDVPEAGANAIVVWNMLPARVRALFLQAFTKGLRDPLSERIRESEWRRAMLELHDLIISCPGCGAEMLLDAGHAGASCWHCTRVFPTPLQIRLSSRGRDPHVVALTKSTSLFPHHLGDDRARDFSIPVATVLQVSPTSDFVEMRNETSDKWVVRDRVGQLSDVAPGGVARVESGDLLFFGSSQGRVTKSS